MLSPSRTGGLGLLVLLSPFSKKGLGLGLGLKSDALSNRGIFEWKSSSLLHISFFIIEPLEVISSKKSKISFVADLWYHFEILIPQIKVVK